MNQMGTGHPRARGLARETWARIGVCFLALAAGASAGCPGDAYFCDPKNYPNGIVDYGLCCADPRDPCYDAGTGGSEAGSSGDAGSASDAGDAEDAGDATADGPLKSCAGPCVAYPPLGWGDPSLVWFGPAPQAPPCPAGAPDLVFTGHADLDAPADCAACACDSPQGSCSLPATLTASTTACPGTDPGAAHTSFGPPLGWDGSCTVHDSVPGGALCQGAPCVHALTIAPPTVTEGGCSPVTATQAASPAQWSTVARACRGTASGGCGGAGLLCAPQSAPGFLVCVSHDGDEECPGPELGPYQDRHVVYKGLQDTRSCSPCTCGPALGSLCTGEISIYGDSGCATDPTYVETLDSSGPACFDLTPGAALGSKRAGPATYAPGACPPSGGAPEGSAVPVNPSTLCCLPSP